MFRSLICSAVLGSILLTQPALAQEEHFAVECDEEELIDAVAVHVECEGARVERRATVRVRPPRQLVPIHTTQPLSISSARALTHFGRLPSSKRRMISP